MLFRSPPKEILDVQILDKFSFVTLPKFMVNDAIEALNGADVDGRSLSVEIASPKGTAAPKREFAPREGRGDNNWGDRGGNRSGDRSGDRGGNRSGGSGGFNRGKSSGGSHNRGSSKSYGGGFKGVSRKGSS